MERLGYFDFDLLLERVNDGYRARVLHSPAGQASAEFVLPFSDEAIENLMLRVGRARRGVRRLESPEMQAAKQFGGKLFDAVFTGSVRGVLHSSLDMANREGKGLRLRLRLADAPDLGDLPWEFLYNASLNRFLALSNKTPLVRYIELPETSRPLKIAPPLRVLVMISSPNDYEALDVEREWQDLNEALGNLLTNKTVVLDRLDAPTLRSLRRKLRQDRYHVLHFIGHGGFDAQSQDGVLLLEDEQGHGRKTSGQYLATVLTDHDSLRLVVLNACEGARTSRADPFAGVAQSLVQQGLPAVIAMQFEITDAASITFAHEFYGALSDGYPVDAALGEARGAIFSELNDLEWGTPVLYLRAPDGVIFTPLTPQERAELERVQRAEEQASEQQRQIETLLLAAGSAYEQSDFDAAEKSLAALLALDAMNAPALELQTNISSAREEQAAEQARLAEEQRVREEQARAREQEIGALLLAAASAYQHNNFDAADRSLAALLALDGANADALALQAQVWDARKRTQAEQAAAAAAAALAKPRTAKVAPSAAKVAPAPAAPAPANASPTILPERTAAKPSGAVIPPQSRNEGLPTRYLVPAAVVILLALLIFGGGAFALGIFNSPTPTNIAVINPVGAAAATETPTFGGSTLPLNELSTQTALAQTVGTRTRQTQVAANAVEHTAEAQRVGTGESQTQVAASVAQNTTQAQRTGTAARQAAGTRAAQNATATAQRRNTTTAQNATATAQRKNDLAGQAAAAQAKLLACAHQSSIPPPTWRIVLCDDFSSDENDWYVGTRTNEYGTVTKQISNGKYQMNYDAIRDVHSFNTRRDLVGPDFYLTVTGKRVSGPGDASYNLIFCQSDSEFYRFAINDNKRFALHFNTNNEWTALLGWADSEAIQPGQANRLSVLVQGSHFTLYINDQKVGEVDNSQLSGGRVGVSIDLDAGSNASFEFDHFELRMP